MRSNYLKTLKTAVLAVTILLLGVGVSLGQQPVNVTAAPSTLTLPDGSSVPMWGYSCSVPTGSLATCAKLNPAATGWSPIIITVPTTATGGLRITLTNGLPAPVPTSLVIVGQLGGGLGASPVRTPSPSHAGSQGQVTWPIVDPTTAGTPPQQLDRVQSFATEVAAAATTVLPDWTNLRPGTYLIESGTHPSIQGPMGLYGILVVTTAPAGTTAGCAYPGATAGSCLAPYNAEVPLLMSEIDPVQNNAVSVAVNTPQFSETAVWSGLPGGCGVPTVHTCYPPAVNYTPLYYLFNGVAFDKTHAAASLFPTAPATSVTGSVLVRLVNAGLRMHVPSIVGAQTGSPAAPGFSLIAEDGNPLPGVPRVQSEVFMAAGKTYDVMVNVPTPIGTATVPPALPVFDRELSLSGNATSRDAGMLAYIGANGGTLPADPSFTAAAANPDTYSSLTACPATPCPALVVSDPAKGVIANDVNVYGVQVVTPPTHGTLTLNANGTFSYTPSAAGTNPDSFVYQANGNPAIFATVTLGAAPVERADGITLGNKTYTSNISTHMSIKPTGVLSTLWDSCTPTVANPCHDRDALGYPLTVALSAGNAPVASTGLTLTMDPNGDGGFNASVTSPGTYTFTYKAQNSQGTVSTSSATVTLNFLAPSNLVVKVMDPNSKAAITDYRWIIEEDRTFFVDPNNTTTTGGTNADCSTTPGRTVPPTFGTNFHTSYMPVVATGCTGALSCESGQKVLGQATVATSAMALAGWTDRRLNRRQYCPERFIWIRPSATTSQCFRGCGRSGQWCTHRARDGRRSDRRWADLRDHLDATHSVPTRKALCICLRG